MQKPTCIILLSEKSSGSSALQKEFCRHPGVHHVPITRHQESETLYWLKAAVLLGMTTRAMRYSNVFPMTPEEARLELVSLVSSNTSPEWSSPSGDESLVFEGWRSLCRALSPVFFEKSPHHLQQRSALELILRSREKLPDISFRFIGLIRNPMDALYSMWSRWRHSPEKRQGEWIRAYENLLWFQERAGSDLKIVRYEEVASDEDACRDLFEFCGIEYDPTARILSDRHIQKWKRDGRFGFQPSVDLMDLAKKMGYAEDVLVNEGSSVLWPIRRDLLRASNSLRRFATRVRYSVAVPPPNRGSASYPRSR